MSPLLLIGPPGCGKTASAYALAGKLQLPVIYASLACVEKAALVGGAIPAHDRLRWLDSDLLIRARAEPVLILLDEVTAAARYERTPLLRIADPSSGLHPQTRVIATANPAEYAAGSGDPLTEPELSRFRIRRVDEAQAIEWMAGRPGLVGLVGRYLHINRAAAMATPAAMAAAVSSMSPYPCPRSWTRAALDAEADPAGEGEVWAECVGAAAAAGWLAWREDQDLPDPEEILAGRRIDVPARPDQVHAVAAALAGRLSDTLTPARTKAAIDWFASASEHRGLICRELARVTKVAAAQVWAEWGGLLKPYAEVADLQAGAK